MFNSLYYYHPIIATIIEACLKHYRYNKNFVCDITLDVKMQQIKQKHAQIESQ